MSAGSRDPLAVNTLDGTCWVRRAVTRDGRGLYAVEGTVAGCPEGVMATLPELAMHGIAGQADALPVPVGYEALSPQRCPQGVHADWAVDSENSHVCPWCELDKLRSRVAELEAAARPIEDDPIQYTLVEPDPSPSRAAVTKAAAEIRAMGDPCVKGTSTLTDVIDLTLRPRTLADWEMWLDLLHVDVGSVTNRGAMSTAKGSWNGVPVVICGHGVGALQVAARPAPGAAS